MIKNGLSKDKIKVLGSTRFCAEWNTIHSKFKGTHKMLQSSLNDKRLKVVFMDTLPMYLVDVWSRRPASLHMEMNLNRLP